mmetsp:Transcript_4412/g.11560  ORF Transcript_4412/g.11560 Transcript_4412/m.11560 type:complete len:295 (+) Transcript_4412:59-943(+)
MFILVFHSNAVLNSDGTQMGEEVDGGSAAVLVLVIRRHALHLDAIPARCCPCWQTSKRLERSSAHAPVLVRERGVELGRQGPDCGRVVAESETKRLHRCRAHTWVVVVQARCKCSQKELHAVTIELSDSRGHRPCDYVVQRREHIEAIDVCIVNEFGHEKRQRCPPISRHAPCAQSQAWLLHQALSALLALARALDDRRRLCERSEARHTHTGVAVLEGTPDSFTVRRAEALPVREPEQSLESHRTHRRIWMAPVRCNGVRVLRHRPRAVCNEHRESSLAHATLFISERRHDSW